VNTTNTGECSQRDGASVRFDNVRVAFDGDEILHIRQSAIELGSLVAIVGPSGCGKSTLLRIIAGLLEPSGGRLSIDAVEFAGGGDVQTGFVFQDATLLPWRRAAANIRLPGELEGQPVSDSRVSDLARLVGLTDADLQKRPAELSGGMKMRVSLARALALSPRLLLLDEPFAALDDLLRQQLQSDVRRIQQELGITTVLVTHNVSEAVYMSDQVWTLGGSPAEVTSVKVVEIERTESVRGTAEFAACVESVFAVLRADGGMPGA